MSAEVQRFLVVAYSGHRSLPDAAPVAAAVERVLDKLTAHAATQRSSIVGIGSAAIGADALVLEALKRRGCPNLLKLPFTAAQFEIEASAAERQRTLLLIETSTAIEYAAPGLGEDEAYLEAGLQTIEPADVLLAVWDGEASRGKGGTAEIVEAAKQIDVPVIRIDAGTGEVEWPAGLAAHAANGSAVREVPVTRAGAAAMFEAFDKSATLHAPKARLLLFRIVMLHLIASAAAIAVVIWNVQGAPEHAIGVFKATALIWALVLATAQRKRSGAWLDARYRAELCRSFLAIWPMRRDALLKLPHPSTSATMEQFHRDLELHWRLCANDAGTLEAALAHYRDERLVQQRRWMAERGRKAARVNHVLHRIAVTTTIVAIVCSGAALIIGMFHVLPDAKSWFKVGATMLPLAAAAIFSYIVANDVARRSDRYTELAAQLEGLEKRLGISRTWPTLGRVVAETEAVLLNELGEWHAMMRFAGRPH